MRAADQVIPHATGASDIAELVSSATCRDARAAIRFSKLLVSPRRCQI
jgi:hypothetical protein